MNDELRSIVENITRKLPPRVPETPVISSENVSSDNRGGPITLPTVPQQPITPISSIVSTKPPQTDFVKGLETKATNQQKVVSEQQKGIFGTMQDILGINKDVEQDQNVVGARFEERQSLIRMQQASQEVSRYNDKLIQEQADLQRRIEQLEQNPEGKLRSGVNSDIRNAERESTRKQADIALVKLSADRDLQSAQFGQQLAKYDLESARAVAKSTIDAQLEPLKQVLEFQKFFYQENKDLLDKTETALLNQKTKESDRQYTESKDALTRAYDFLAKSGENGAPTAVIQQMLSAINGGNFDEVVGLSAPYLRDPIKNEQLTKLKLENRDLENPDLVATTGQADDTLKLAAANIGAIVAKTGPAQKIFSKGYNTALAQGEDSAWRYLRNQYSNNVLSGKQQEDYFNVQDGLAGYQAALDYLESNPDLNTGFYKATAEGLKPKFNTPKDQRYATLLSLINQAETPIRKKNYGTAITGNELVTSQRSLFNEGDDRNTVALKLRQGIVALDNGLNRGMAEAYGLPFEPKPYPLPGDITDLSDDDIRKEYQLFQSGQSPVYVNQLPEVSGFFSSFFNQIFEQ